ncbi:cortex morphogenetic protein CmpA [Xylanibacillus composti]|nr:cortex morphogenetic protein CmpA [Xylanibacillus composti]MDT9723714.1 cortex morphogenetic protein CmpA [Xylanibacillus composti]
MPKWLYNQLMRAYQSKDRRQIRLLNDCWYFYRTRHVEAGEESEESEPHTRRQ